MPDHRIKRKTQIPEPLTLLMGNARLGNFLWRHAENFQLVNFLRDLYGAVDYGPADWAEERQARLDFARSFREDQIFDRLQGLWPELETSRRARIVWTIIGGYARRLDLPQMRFVCPTNAGVDMHCEPVRYSGDLKKQPADSYGEIFDRGGGGMLATFRGGMESCIYLAVRHYQFTLAASGIGPEDPRYKIARLYQLEFKRDEVLQAFPWAPDEKERWFAEPGMGHALEAVRETMALWTGDEDYRISDDFMAAWGRRFDRHWQDVLFETEGDDESRLRHYRQYITAADESALREIDDGWRKCLVTPLMKIAGGNRNLSPQATDVVQRLVDTAPDRFGFCVSLHKSVRETIGLAETFNRRAMTDMGLSDRMTMVKALLNNAEPAVAAKARTLALNFLASCPYPAAVEEKEDALLEELRKRIDADPLITASRKAWGELPFGRKLEALRRVMKVHAATFGYEPAEELTTFCLSRADYEAAAKARGEAGKLYPMMVAFRSAPRESDQNSYPGLQRKKTHTIAINLHANALDGYINDYDLAEALIIHEQTHRNDNQEQDRIARGEPMIHDWRAPMMGGILAQDAVSGKADSDETLAYAFYRASMAERHAFALQRKMVGLRKSGSMPSEKIVFGLDLKGAGVEPAML